MASVVPPQGAPAAASVNHSFKKIAVFCGASGGGRDGAYIAAAKALGEEMVKRQIGLVYGAHLGNAAETNRGPHPPRHPSRRPIPLPPSDAGGGNVGLMGAVAHTVADGLGEDRVIGVIPTALAPREVGRDRLGAAWGGQGLPCRPMGWAGAAAAPDGWPPSRARPIALDPTRPRWRTALHPRVPHAERRSRGTLWARSGWWMTCTRGKR